MARIDWALLCDQAFLDRHDRLCIIGVTRSLPALRLPLTMNRVMLVARLADVQQVDEIDVAVGVVTPSGFHTARRGSSSVSIEMAREYVLATFRDLPLTEEGVHRFQIRLRGQPVVAVEMPVLAAEVESMETVQ